ncbi:DUF6879 family protein [Actinoplanes sp. NPDC051861]|uniref:DUF6879 family protein n=1 Tax=Actinoplanes sp. NPDC051861 TaxID=3155170 RepID=UPI00341907D2
METPSLTRKILVALASGGFTFLVTNVSDQPLFPALILSLLVGGIVLLTQLLLDLEHRQRSVEAALRSVRDDQTAALRAEVAKISEATALYQQLEGSAPGLDLAGRAVRGLSATAGSEPSLAIRVAQAEIAAAVDFLETITRGGAVTEGENRDWLITLTRQAHRSMNAVSLCSESPGGDFSDDGFWNTDIGAYYLDNQREAVRRGVDVRRLFVVPHDRLAAHPGLTALVRLHRENGITVQVLVATDLPPSRRHQLPDMVVFDEEVCFELSSAPPLDEDTPRYFIQTRVTTEAATVQSRLRLFEDLWKTAGAARKTA